MDNPLKHLTIKYKAWKYRRQAPHYFLKNYARYLRKIEILCPWDIVALKDNSYIKTFYIGRVDNHKLNVIIYISQSGKFYVFSLDNEAIFFLFKGEKTIIMPLVKRAQYLEYFQKLAVFEQEIFNQSWKIRTMDLPILQIY